MCPDRKAPDDVVAGMIKTLAKTGNGYDNDTESNGQGQGFEQTGGHILFLRILIRYSGSCSL